MSDTKKTPVSPFRVLARGLATELSLEEQTLVSGGTGVKATLKPGGGMDSDCIRVPTPL